MDATRATGVLERTVAAAAEFRGAGSGQAFARVDETYDETLAALRWLVDHDLGDDALRLACGLMPYWAARNRNAEGAAWLEVALAAPVTDRRRRARGLHDLGQLLFWQGRYVAAEQQFEEAEALARGVGDVNLIALALAGRARIALGTDLEAARRLCRTALELTESAGDSQGRSSALHVLGVAAQMAGDLAEAKQAMSQRIEAGRRAGNLALVSSEAGNLCMVERQLGNLSTAERLGREALEIDVRRGDGRSIPWKVNGLAAVAAAAGNLELAARLIGVADKTMEAAGGEWPPDELVQYNETLEILRAGLGSEELERQRTSGLAMDFNLAMEIALGRSELAE